MKFYAYSMVAACATAFGLGALTPEQIARDYLKRCNETQRLLNSTPVSAGLTPELCTSAENTFIALTVAIVRARSLENDAQIKAFQESLKAVDSTSATPIAEIEARFASLEQMIISEAVELCGALKEIHQFGMRYETNPPRPVVKPEREMALRKKIDSLATLLLLYSTQLAALKSHGADTNVSVERLTDLMNSIHASAQQHYKLTPLSDAECKEIITTIFNRLIFTVMIPAQQLMILIEECDIKKTDPHNEVEIQQLAKSVSQSLTVAILDLCSTTPIDQTLVEPLMALHQ